MSNHIGLQTNPIFDRLFQSNMNDIELDYNDLKQRPHQADDG